MSILDEAKRVLKLEAQSILDMVDRTGEELEKAVSMILAAKGKVIISGMGKSGLIGRKISSTLSSTGTPALFLHPAESSHGDLGVVSEGDVILAISYGGESAELNDILSFASRRGIPTIAMTGKLESTLARNVDVVLDVSVAEEACPLKLAPTSSSTATLALGDALAMCLLKQRGFQEKDFAEFHPGGKLGRRLLLKVEDLMHLGEGLPLLAEDAKMAEVLSTMSSKEVRGVAGILDSSNKLTGIITDGDIRRRLEKHENPMGLVATEIMSTQPKTISKYELAERALFLMEEFKIQSLFVVDPESDDQQPVGLLHLQDLLKARIR